MGNSPTLRRTSGLWRHCARPLFLGAKKGPWCSDGNTGGGPVSPQPCPPLEGTQVKSGPRSHQQEVRSLFLAFLNSMCARIFKEHGETAALPTPKSLVPLSAVSSLLAVLLPYLLSNLHVG